MVKLANKTEEDLLKIVNFVKNSEEYKKTIYYKELIENDTELTSKIDRLKELQMKYVRTKDYNVKNELDSLNNELSNNTNFTLYNFYLDKVNNYIDIIKDNFNNYFDNLFNEKFY